MRSVHLKLSKAIGLARCPVTKNSEDDKKYWAIAASKDSMDSFIDLKKCVLHAGVVGRERMTSIGLVMFINR